MNTFAVIDVGSNSVKLHVGKVGGRDEWLVLRDETRITRLGEGLQATGEIDPAAMDRNLAAIAAYLAEARRLGAGQIVAVGTMCLRTARNTAVFLDRVRTECDLEIEVIDGREEARLSFLAVLSWLGGPAGPLVVVDIGGGSTEFIFGDRGEIVDRVSLDIGAVGLTERFLRSDLVTPTELENMQVAISESLARLPAKQGGGRVTETLVGVGGTVTCLGAVKHVMPEYDPDVIQGTALTRADIERFGRRFQSLTIEERRQITGLPPGRADIILAGTGIVQGAMQALGFAELTISTRGLRHGLARDRFLAT